MAFCGGWCLHESELREKDISILVDQCTWYSATNYRSLSLNYLKRYLKWSSVCILLQYEKSLHNTIYARPLRLRYFFAV